MVPNGDYGNYGDADNLRKAILQVEEASIPLTVAEMRSFDPEKFKGITPEVLIATSMAMDSFKFNLATYIAADSDLNLFGDSRGMSMLLEAKFKGSVEKQPGQRVSHEMAYTLLDRMLPNSAFMGKKMIDIVRFRNSMNIERERFKERILEMTVELVGLDPQAQKRQFDVILYKHLLPEARDYQARFANNWDKFFKDSTKAIALDAKGISELIVTVLPLSLPAALLTATAYMGAKTLPFFVDYLKDKESLSRNNPYAYLMDFK